MDSVEAWLPLLTDSDPKERARALEALVQIAPERARDALEEGLHDPSPLVRASVARLAHRISPPLGPETLEVLLQDLDPEVRIRGLRALAIHGPSGRGALRGKLSRETDPKVLATLLSELGPLAELEDVPSLEAKLSHEDPRVRANAVDALDSVFGRRWGEALRIVQEDNNNRVRGNVLRSLARLDPPAAAKMAQEMGKHPEVGFRVSGVWAAGCTGRYEILHEVLGLLEDPDPQVRLQVLRVLSEHPKLPWGPKLWARLAEEEDPMLQEIAQDLLTQAQAT